MNQNAEATRPIIQVTTDKIPAVLAERLGKAAWEATYEWLTQERK